MFYLGTYQISIKCETTTRNGVRMCCLATRETFQHWDEDSTRRVDMRRTGPRDGSKRARPYSTTKQRVVPNAGRRAARRSPRVCLNAMVRTCMARGVPSDGEPEVQGTWQARAPFSGSSDGRAAGLDNGDARG